MAGEEVLDRVRSWGVAMLTQTSRAQILQRDLIYTAIEAGRRGGRGFEEGSARGARLGLT